MEKKELYTEISSQEMSDFYARLKTDLRIKIMELQKKQIKQALDIIDGYFLHQEKDEKELKEIETMLDKFENIGKFDDEYGRISQRKLELQLAYRTLKNMSNPTFNAMIKNRAKNKRDLVHTFKTDNALLIEIYKKIGEEARKSSDFQEMPRYLWDKARIEEKINKVRIGEHICIEDILPDFGRLSEKKQNIILDYFTGGDPSALAKKLNVSGKRLKQMREYGIRQMVRKAIEGDMNYPCPDSKNVPKNLPQEVLTKPISDVDGLSEGTKKILRDGGLEPIHTIGELFEYSTHELMKMDGIRKKMIDEIEKLKNSLLPLGEVIE